MMLLVGVCLSSDLAKSTWFSFLHRICIWVASVFHSQLVIWSENRFLRVCWLSRPLLTISQQTFSLQRERSLHAGMLGHGLSPPFIFLTLLDTASFLSWLIRYSWWVWVLDFISKGWTWFLQFVWILAKVRFVVICPCKLWGHLSSTFTSSLTMSSSNLESCCAFSIDVDTILFMCTSPCSFSLSSWVARHGLE